MTKQESQGIWSRVQLKEIHPSPFRDPAVYPISEGRIRTLTHSIRAVGFWGVLVGRRNDKGEVEIAFGHHRLAALNKVYGPEFEVMVIVDDLSDEDMQKMMSLENDEHYNCSVAAIDNAVSKALKYLSEHREEALSSAGPEAKRIRVGAPMVAKFLEKPVNQVEKSIERLNAIKKGAIDPKALYLLPSASAADNFIELVYQKKLESQYQIQLAKLVCTQQEFGHYSMVDALRFAIHTQLPPSYMRERPKGQDERSLKKQLPAIKKFGRFLQEVCQSWDLEKDFREGEVSADTQTEFIGHLSAIKSSILGLEDKLKDKVTRLDLSPEFRLHGEPPRQLLFIRVLNLGYAPMVINAPCFEFPNGVRFGASEEASELTFPYTLPGQESCLASGVGLQEIEKFYKDTIGGPALRFRLVVEDSTGRIWRTTEIWRQTSSGLDPEKRNRGRYGFKVTGRKRQLEKPENVAAWKEKKKELEDREKKAKGR